MDGIRKAVRADIPRVAAIYDHILTEEEQGRAAIGWVRGVYPTERTAQDALEAGIVPCEFNGIPGVRLVCLEKKL